jgi:nucleoside-diphosphate-sugar epimerase
MLEIYEAQTGLRAVSELLHISGEAFYGAGYEDGERLPPDITKMAALGWRPRHGLRQTVGDAMAHYLGRYAERTRRALHVTRAQTG